MNTQELNYEFFAHSQENIVVDNKVLCPHCQKASEMTEKNGLLLCKDHTSFVVATKAIDVIKETAAFKEFVFPVCKKCTCTMLAVSKNTASPVFGHLYFKCSCKEEPLLLFLNRRTMPATPVTSRMSDEYFTFIKDEITVKKNKKPSHARRINL